MSISGIVSGNKTVKLSQMSGLTRVGAGMLAGAIVSLALLDRAVSSNAGPPVLWLGLLSLGLISGGTLCLLLAIAKFFESRRRSRPSPGHVNTQDEYVAEYSWADRGIAMGMTVFFGALVVFFLLRSGRPQAIIISAVLFCFALIYMLHVTGTHIRFDKEGLIATVSWVRHVSGRYTEVRRVSGKPGTVKIEFSDGRSLKFHPGLGDPDKVIAYLRARCPESVDLR